MGVTLFKLAKISTVSSQLHVTQIWIYPIKSLGGIKLKSAKVFEKGLEFDRRYMLVDSSGMAMTQRQHPEMARFRTSITNGVINVTHLGDSISIPVAPREFVAEHKVTIWDDSIMTNELSQPASSWFSERLNTSCRLVFFPEGNSRPVDLKYQISGEHVSLADAYPLLIIGENSLWDLNSRLSEPVPMNRFRPNIVFSGAEAYEEDSWNVFTIGNNRFAAVKPCARCVLTTVNQETAVKGSEPLKTLSRYRTQNNKVYFGQNVIALSADEISEGEIITVISRKLND
jgi:uncharacterized protein